jgi:hypothetical protein
LAKTKISQFSPKLHKATDTRIDTTLILDLLHGVEDWTYFRACEIINRHEKLYRSASWMSTRKRESRNHSPHVDKKANFMARECGLANFYTDVAEV